MTAEDIYYSSLAKGIRLFLRDGKLLYTNPDSHIVSFLTPLWKSYKESLIDWLSENEYKVKSISPLSINQKSLWFEYLKNPTSSSYNVCTSFDLVGYKNLAAIRDALSQLIRAYSFLTDRVVMIGNDPFWLHTDDKQIPISIEENITTNRIEEFRNDPLSLEEDSSLRVLLSTQDTGAHITFVIHHIVCDAMSLRFLIDDFFLLLSGEALDPKKKDYHDFTYGQLKLSHNKEFRKSRAEKLRTAVGSMDHSPVDLPRDYPRGIFSKGECLRILIGPAIYKGLCSIRDEWDMPMQVLVKGIWERFLETISQDEQPLYAVTTLGRDHSHLAGGVGYFMNPVITSCSVRKGHDEREFFRSIRQKSLAHLAVQDYPMAFSLEDLKIKRANNYNPLFQVLFNYLDEKTLGPYINLFQAEPKEFSSKGFTLKPFYLAQQMGQFDLTFEVVEGNYCLDVFLKYDRNLFSPETIRKMGILFNEMTKGLVTNYKIPEVSWENPRRRINVAANYTSDPLINHLQNWKRSSGEDWIIKSAPYDQILQLLLDDSQIFYKDDKTLNIICLMLQEWYKKNESLDELFIALETYNNNNQFPLFIFSTENFNGDYYEQEDAVRDKVHSLSHIFFYKTGDFKKIYQIKNGLNPITFEKGHIPYRDHAFAAMASFIFRKLYASLKQPLKLVAVDGDNTLWKGVVGEEGVEGVALKEEHRMLQNKMKEWRENGIPICLLTKNNESLIQELFLKRGDFPLKWDDFTCIKSNWGKKSQNLLEIAELLNLGTDSFLFIDDNPIELAEVADTLPEVICLPAIATNGHIGQFAEHIWAFDKLSITKEDSSRVDFYNTDVKRAELSKGISLADFIASLQLNITIEPINKDMLDRAVQLSHRTNQFNMLTQRLSTSELKEFLENNGSYYTVDVSDRFGDYGIVGLMGVSRNKESYKLENFLLSCRAMGKNIEEEMFLFLCNAIVEKGAKELIISVQPNNRNIPAVEFFNRIVESSTKISEEKSIGLYEDEIRTFHFTDKKKPETSRVKRSKTKEGNQKYSEKFLFDTAYHLGPEYWKDFEKKGKAKESGDIIGQLKTLWCEKLGHRDFTLDDSFFDAGGRSLDIPYLISELYDRNRIKLEIVDFFLYPTINSLADHILSEQGGTTVKAEKSSSAKRKRANGYYKRVKGRKRNG